MSRSEPTTRWERIATRPVGPVGPSETTIDPAAIFEAKGISKEDLERVERAKKLLRSLPVGAPPKVGKEIVETALRTFGIVTEKIVDAARREVAALEAFVATNAAATAKLVEEGEGRVRSLEQEIARVKQATEHATAVQGNRNRLASVEMAAVRQVLAFFGEVSDHPLDLELEEATEERSRPSSSLLGRVPPARTAPSGAEAARAEDPPGTATAEQQPGTAKALSPLGETGRVHTHKA